MRLPPSLIKKSHNKFYLNLTGVLPIKVDKYKEVIMALKRRDFLKLGIGGMSAVVLGSNLKIPGIFKDNAVYAANLTYNLTITDAMVEMADSTPAARREVYMWVFAELHGGLLVPHFPGSTIFAQEGDSITINITNALDEQHAFAISGTRISSSAISPGGSTSLTFIAPRAGTYIYHDPLNAPVNRVLGLHGTLIVLPVPASTPYSNPTTQVRNLFDDLGTTPHFPPNTASTGTIDYPRTNGKWVPERTWIWNFHTIDPRWNALAEAGQNINRMDFIRDFVPSYFLINGKSGFYSGHDHNISPFGRVGEPALIRVVNTGLATQSIHLHANHFYITSVSGAIMDNIFCVDTFRLFPMDRIDWIFPFIRPPDIPNVAANNPNKFIRLDAAQELQIILPVTTGISPLTVQLSPIGYPTHDHAEPSQTASGGNYPFGAMVHLTFTGDIDGVFFPGGDTITRTHN